MYLRKIITYIAKKKSNSQLIFWFSLSFTFAFIYGLLAWREAFSSDYVIQDDARQHVFWMLRFIDEQLFPNDLIADYFQSVAPVGYTNLYRLAATIGINPLFFNKILPIILGLITTAYCFGVCLQILPIPLAGFITSLLLNQYLWLRDDLISATAVAFVYPLFVAFLYYLLKRSLIPCLIAIALLGLFYPQAVLISAGILILQLLTWREGKLQVVKEVKEYRFCLAGVGVALLVMLFYALKSSEYGPVITAAEAKTMLEFAEDGKSEFFVQDIGDYWFTGQRSGIMPRFKTVLPLIAGGLLPLLCLYPSPFPLLKQITSKVSLLVEITLASLGMFLLSHALLFKFHLPSRYTEHSLRIVTAIAAGIALAVIIDALLQFGRRHRGSRLEGKTILAWGLALLILAIPILNSSLVKKFPKTEYVIGKVPALYEFFSRQPKDILIASLTEEVNNLPSFSQRSILVGGEGYPVPYHKGYYKQFRQRTIDLIEAQYNSNLEEVQKFIQKYDVDFWLLEKSAFKAEYIQKNEWMMQYQPIAEEAISRLKQGTIPVIAHISDRCSVFQASKFIVLDSDCIMNLQ